MASGHFASIPEILDELRAGRMVVLTDDESRENEGDLVLPAQFVSPEAVTFMLASALGYLCLSLTEADCDRLNLVPQGSANTTARGTAFTVSIDLHPRHGGTTGVSARERARCIGMAIDPGLGPEDFARPGHVNPLRSRNGGVLVRTGQTEGSVDLCRLAGLYPAAVIIEVMRPDGEMARLPDLVAFCAKHGLKMCSVAQVIEHRLARESLVRRLAPEGGTPVRTREGTFNLIAYESLVDPLPHVALTCGGVGGGAGGVGAGGGGRPVLVRMHQRNLLGDIFDDLDSTPEGVSSGELLRAAMRMIQREGEGAIVYLRPEGVGDVSASLEQRLQALRRPAYARGGDAPDLTHPAFPPRAAMPRPLREFGIGGQILRDLGITRLRLMSNHATALPGLEAFGLEIVERVAVGVGGGGGGAGL